MKTEQAVLVEPGRFERRPAEVAPGTGQVLLEVLACGLCKWELGHWKGDLGECPQTLGHEVVGRVLELGPGVEGVEPGDTVTALPDALNGFARHCVVTASRCARIAPDLDPRGGLGEPLSCVITTLDGAAAAAGEVGVVVGCGPMGLWCIQALAGAPLSALIAIDMDENRLDRARSFGATHTINPSSTNPAVEVESITGGRLADFIIEGTGVPAVFASLHELLKTGRGRLLLMSSHEEATAAFDWRPLQVKGAIVHATHPAYAIDQVQNMRRAIALYNTGRFASEGIITHTFALESIGEAFGALESPPSGYIKGIVQP
ncbi:MAG: zinc-dependent alcohol dehydrogenase [Planctomycetota bacterium]|jgi:threonine dehydrogenase-like Zn-dependent dehydrogenase